ncbi:MAG: ATP-dependent Clp protease adapter ClpS [Alphaproteobacteria bacterium]|jgi:ATP-dependent Clp protease adaptor protein ClpS|nr:ATP-dependent Clp protease adapter ClpS [Alphaproteobacteria bacterium]|tara:strand:+ start:129 stop:443 length:315 start_codon:yes stop_codon:yes gene_type:complete
MNDELKNPSSQTLVVPKVKKKVPQLYKVILLNDDYTPMEYVVALLREVFKKSESDAVNIMLMVHKKGAGVCGIFTKEIAETKVFTVIRKAKSDQHPLKCVMEPE